MKICFENSFDTFLSESDVGTEIIKHVSVIRYVTEKTKNFPITPVHCRHYKCPTQHEINILLQCFVHAVFSNDSVLISHETDNRMLYTTKVIITKMIGNIDNNRVNYC